MGRCEKWVVWLCCGWPRWRRPSRVAAPPTLDRPGKKFRFISLAEARAIALEQSILDQRLQIPGIGLDSTQISGLGLESCQGPSDAESIRVLAGGKTGSKRIVIAGVRRDPRPAELERNINQLLLNVENAYWNLYGSYWQLYSREQALRLAYETWKITKAKYRAGRISQAAVAQAEGQYNLFRSQRLQTLDTVLDNERQLRAMLGLPIQDGTRLVPSDAPTLEEKKPEWRKAVKKAMNRPEVYLAEAEVVQHLVLDLGDGFKDNDGASLCINHGSGKQCEPTTPVCPREAELQLRRAFQVVQDQEMKAERFLALYYRRMSSAYFQIKAARAQRKAFAAQLQIRQKLYQDGSNEPGIHAPVTLNLLLEAQRFWTEALDTEYQAIVTFNNSIAGWEYAKGDIMKHAHVRLAEGASANSEAVRATVQGVVTWLAFSIVLPPCNREAIRAVEREHKRTRRHVRREPGVMANSPLTAPHACQDGEDAKAVTLVVLWKCFPLLKQASELHSSDDQGPLVEYRVSEIFTPRRVHGGVSP